MKKLILVSVLFLFITDLSAQNKEETEIWIQDKIEQFGYSNDIDIWNNYKVEYRDGIMIIREHHKNITDWAVTELITIYQIPIKELASVRFEEKYSNVWMYLRVRGDKKIHRYATESQEQSFKTEIQILLRKSIINENLPSRLTKAFNNLIKFYGGTIVEEKY